MQKPSSSFLYSFDVKETFPTESPPSCLGVNLIFSGHLYPCLHHYALILYVALILFVSVGHDCNSTVLEQNLIICHTPSIKIKVHPSMVHWSPFSLVSNLHTSAPIPLQPSHCSHPICPIFLSFSLLASLPLIHPSQLFGPFPLSIKSSSLSCFKHSWSIRSSISIM